MKIFICNRSYDNTEVELIVSALLIDSDYSLTILREITHSAIWKSIVEKKIQESDFVLFMVGEKTFESEQIKWEYAKAKELNKQIFGFKLSKTSEDSILFCEGFPVFINTIQCVNNLKEIFKNDRQLLIEQYKIMVASTEKVTDQRMKVNNLFFTVTSTILSLTLLIGKTFSFSTIGILGMLSITSLAFLVTLFWKKLIESYGKLNQGKFIIIDEIEKKLRTNMFSHEWQILTKKVSYEPNTQTEVKIVKKFRLFIILMWLIELAYFLNKLICLIPMSHK